MRQRSMVLVMIGALLLGLLITLAPGRAIAAAPPGQVVTVSAPTATSTYATVEAWALQSDGRYKRVAHFPSARIGAAGMGAASETVARTPTGQYRLTQPFGIKPNPGVTTSYVHVDRNDVWTGSTGTVMNEHRRCAPGTCPSSYGSLERLSDYPGSYNYGVFIGYNAAPPYGTGAVAGRGSAFFLHVKNSMATGGCVAIAESEMVWLLRWLRSAANPIIAIGVGPDAYDPIRNRYI
jgi:L,D-peptidoglycan transpeptidase YkuD (ErfK/YbiS/YcfS/YnhG family)